MYHRAFALSKADSFLSRNTILYEEEQPVLLSAPDTEQRTILKMCIPVEKDNKAWENVSVQDIKKALIDHYILLLCNIKNELPQIEIKCYLADQELDKADITKEDIPDPTTTDTYISVPKYKISNDMKRLEEIEEDPIIIQILPYKICADRLSSSEIKITSKGELSNSTKIKVTCIDPQAAKKIAKNLFFGLLFEPFFYIAWKQMIPFEPPIIVRILIDTEFGVETLECPFDHGRFVCCAPCFKEEVNRSLPMDAIDRWDKMG